MLSTLRRRAQRSVNLRRAFRGNGARMNLASTSSFHSSSSLLKSADTEEYEDDSFDEDDDLAEYGYNDPFGAVPAIDEMGVNAWDASKMEMSLSPETYAAYQAKINENVPLTKGQRNEIAEALSEWAMSRGAVTYSHWFMPVRGLRAGLKNDAFIDINYGTGESISRTFNGTKLFHGETDGSSFPNGGLRATHTAAAYTSWDCTSAPFVRGQNLYIPSVFVSYRGHALDEKTPHLLSQEAINREGMRLRKLLGDTESSKVVSNVGWEQEFFLVDKDLYNERPDLMATGRTIVGAPSPLGQQLDNNYFTDINPRAKKFLADLQDECWRLGMNFVVGHNEVAPSQHEYSPIFSLTNYAADQNLASVEIMHEVASKHGLAVLTHEKPYAGINGSGKHNNWGLNTDSGENLFTPGKTAESQANFISMVACLVRGFDLHGDLIRAGVATAGNDHRLGAQEAPPAIMSVYTGAVMEEHLKKVIAGGDLAGYTGAGDSDLDIATMAIQPIPAPAEDRNRTAPFPFCGNRFEFRAVGSNQQIYWPLTVLNTIVADSMSHLSSLMEGGMSQRDATAKMLEEHWRVVFNGNGYDEAWHKEAEEDRGLPNLRNTPAALRILDDNKNKELFASQKVFQPEEVEARRETLLEEYSNTILIEANCMLDMMNQGCIPACVEDLGEYTSKGLDSMAGTRKDAYELLAKNTTALQDALENMPDADAQAAADYCGETVIPAMNDVRESCDLAERLCSTSKWPYPNYQELLFQHHKDDA
eukprot:g2807.t1